MPLGSRAAQSGVGTVRVGTAGWSLPKELAAHFPGEGTHLERYGERLRAVEINSSFYRPHRPSTYERWAESVPEGFRFAVKVPREVTHQRRLADCREPLERFLGEVASLGGKLGPLLVQLPPSLAYDRALVEPFLVLLRERHGGGVVFEPRHRTWFAPEAEKLLVAHRVARVAADPAVVPAAAEPGGWPGLVYYRWHGSPRVYYSPYPPDAIAGLADEVGARAAAGAEVWCILDNTAAGAATANALELTELLAR
jgi:uncharacterized protein YecE (DUF72 family)